MHPHLLPPRIARTFAEFPVEIVELCRPHAWDAIATPHQEGMKSIRDVLLHMVGAEAFLISHVVRGRPRERLSPEAFTDLDSILDLWKPQRDETVGWLETLTPEERASRRAFSWDQSEIASVEEIVWHVVTHEQYHRGQIFTRLALLGRRDLPDHDMLR